jgi:hypothetical protein
MTSRYILACSIALSLSLTAPVLAQPPGEPKAGTEAKANASAKAPKAASEPVFIAAGDLKWIDLDPKGDGSDDHVSIVTGLAMMRSVCRSRPSMKSCAPTSAKPNLR